MKSAWKYKAKLFVTISTSKWVLNLVICMSADMKPLMVLVFWPWWESHSTHWNGIHAMMISGKFFKNIKKTVFVFNRWNSIFKNFKKKSSRFFSRFYSGCEHWRFFYPRAKLPSKCRIHFFQKGDFLWSRIGKRVKNQNFIQIQCNLTFHL